MTDEEILSLINKKKKKGLSKYFSLFLITLIFFIGVAASFKNSFIEMSEYVMFLSEFKLILSVLISSVGVGLAVKHYKGKDE
jgi:hypothetical protein